LLLNSTIYSYIDIVTRLKLKRVLPLETKTQQAQAKAPKRKTLIPYATQLSLKFEIRPLLPNSTI